LGRLYDESDHDPGRARDVWQLALYRWSKDPEAVKDDKPHLRKSLFTLPTRTGSRQLAAGHQLVFKPPKKFRRTRTRCNSGLMKSKRKWRRKQCSVGCPLLTVQWVSWLGGDGLRLDNV